jgi:hypothetical protein
MKIFKIGKIRMSGRQASRVTKGKNIKSAQKRSICQIEKYGI